jgi:hypothetical protein
LPAPRGACRLYRSSTLAVLIVAQWVGVWLALGAWHTRLRDADRRREAGRSAFPLIVFARARLSGLNKLQSDE